MATSEWLTWHDAYARPGSALADRLAAVRDQIRGCLDRTAPGPVQVISVCAGDGRDLLGVLADRVDAERVSALLVEWDEALAALAVASARGVGSRVEVQRADAADSSVYAGTAPAGLVLLCGVLGNISDEDVQRTIAAVPQLCAPGAEVIWTRHRRRPDLTPSIRRWFGEAGFTEFDFVAPAAAGWSVGVHRLGRAPVPLRRGEHWFTFVR